MGVPNTVTGGRNGPRLDASLGTMPLNAIPNHQLQAGTNRMVLLVVASEFGGGGVSASRPDVVTYGGVNMVAGPEQSGGTRHWAPDLFTYYLTDASGLTGTGARAIVVDGTPATPNPGSPGVIVAHALQLNGVRQTAPFSSFEGSVVSADPDTIPDDVPVGVAGSRVYSFTAALWSTTLNYVFAPMPTGVSLTQTLNSAALEGGGTNIRLGGVYVSGNSASLLPILTSPDPPEYTVTWSTQTADVLTHLALVILPAQQ
jgi:hypothetical protein